MSGFAIANIIFTVSVMIYYVICRLLFGCALRDKDYETPKEKLSAYWKKEFFLANVLTVVLILAIIANYDKFVVIGPGI